MDYLVPMERFVFDAMQWPIEKTRQAIRDTLQDYGRIEWQWTFLDLERPQTMLTKMSLTNSIQIWGIKGLSVTWSNLVVTWKIRSHMGIIS